MKLIQQVRGTATLDVLLSLQNLQPLKLFPLHCTLESFGRSVYMTTYFGAKHLVTANGHDDTELKWRVACGASSGVVAWTAIYPLDVLRSRLYSGSAAGPGREEIWPCSRPAQGGGLPEGCLPQKSGACEGVVLTMYDQVPDKIRSMGWRARVGVRTLSIGRERSSTG